MRTYGCIVMVVLLCAGGSPARAQGIGLPITPRVDTTSAEIREIFHLWQAYLNERPDSVRRTAYWSEREQAQYGDFDLSRRWLYGYPAGGSTLHKLLGIRPRLLSIEPEADAYVIRTLYAPDALTGFQGLYSIQRIYARNEAGRWRLCNALPVLTRDWVRRRFGLIEYVHPPGHPFDEEAAQRTSAFADAIVATFGLSLPRTVEYYVAPSVSEMARMSGLDFTWDTNDGRAYVENGQVFVGNGREDYLHEVAHALFGPLEVAPIISEGLATYAGGFGGKPYSEAAAGAAKRLRAAAETRLDDVLRERAYDVEVYYVTGGLLVEAVVERGGAPALKRFFELAKTPEGIYQGMQELLGVSPEAADAFWRHRLSLHAGQ